jgi:3-oxoacyl-[acyl-carrier protein] reductase
MDMQGKIGIVTGGGTGIGRAAALALARQGVAVAIVYSRSATEAEETAAAITAEGGRALAVRADVAREDDVRSMVAWVAERLGGIDLLVNSSGITEYIPLRDLDAVTDETWDRIFAVNVKGIFYCARAAAPYMRARGQGAIVNVTSVAGVTGDGSSLPYAVSKAAANGLTRSLARALAPTIRVCAVAPGIVKTRWVAGREEHVDRLSKSALLGLTASPDDVAAMIVALLAQDAMTGQIVVVDGGLAL